MRSTQSDRMGAINAFDGSTQWAEWDHQNGWKGASNDAKWEHSTGSYNGAGWEHPTDQLGGVQCSTLQHSAGRMGAPTGHMGAHTVSWLVAPTRVAWEIQWSLMGAREDRMGAPMCCTGAPSET